jgi:hypothetical protein
VRQANTWRQLRELRSAMLILLHGEPAAADHRPVMRSFAAHTLSPPPVPSAIFDPVVIDSPSEELKQFLARLSDEAREVMTDCRQTNASTADLHDLLTEVIDCLRAELP